MKAHLAGWAVQGTGRICPRPTGTLMRNGAAFKWKGELVKRCGVREEGAVRVRELVRKRRLCSSSTPSTQGSENHKVFTRLVALAETDPNVLSRVGRSMSSRTLNSVSKAVEAEALALRDVSPVAPTKAQLLLVFFAPMPLFIVFGFIDNAVMILAGESFDRTLGVAFGISTMAAAALGNLVSDVMGLGVGGVVEEWFEKSGLNRDPGLSRTQEALSVVRRWRFAGNAVGVSIGCILGMAPLLFMDFDKIASLKRQSAINDLLSAVMEFVGDALNAETAVLYVVDSEKGEIWTKAGASTGGSKVAEGGTVIPGSSDSGWDNTVRFPIGEGVVGYCAKTGNIINTNDVSDLSRWGSRSNRVSGQLNRSVLCSPVFDLDGDIIGVLQVANRKDGSKEPFRVKDEVALTAMTSHISMALERALHNDADGGKLVENDKDAILKALKASFEHHSHHLRFATSRAKNDYKSDKLTS